MIWFCYFPFHHNTFKLESDGISPKTVKILLLHCTENTYCSVEMYVRDVDAADFSYGMVKITFLVKNTQSLFLLLLSYVLILFSSRDEIVCWMCVLKIVHGITGAEYNAFCLVWAPYWTGTIPFCSRNTIWHHVF